MNKPVLVTLALAAATLLVASCLSSSKDVMESKPLRTLSYTASEKDLANCFVQSAIENGESGPGIPVATQLRDTVKITRMHASEIAWELTLHQGTADLRMNEFTPLNSDWEEDVMAVRAVREGVRRGGLALRARHFFTNRSSITSSA